MTTPAPVPVVTKSTGPRVRFGELTRPGMEETPATGHSETPPVLRSVPSILRRQDSTNSVAPLLTPGRNLPEDQVSLASTADSGADISTSSLTVAPSGSRRSSTVSSIPPRPPRPPQGLFATSEAPEFPRPTATRSGTTSGDPSAMGNPWANVGSRFSDSTDITASPLGETGPTGLLNTASLVPDKPRDLNLRTEQRSPAQAKRDLQVASETDQPTTISRSGSRKIGLPSNPRAGLSRQ
jgi:hypothetical protein